MSANKIRVLVLGKTGMLGHMVCKVLARDRRLRVFGTQMNRKGGPGYFNVLEGNAGLRALFSRNGGFDYCINCIGITANRIDARDPASVKRARAINAQFPVQLAGTAAQYGCRVIHISTDGVFQGTRSAYTERSRPDCEDIYGRSKLAGEARAENFLTVRCSIMGPSPVEKGGLWEWFIGLPSGAEARGFVNHLWNGVTTLQFAQLCRQIITGGVFDALRGKSAVFHFAPNKPLTKYRLLLILKRFLKKDSVVTPASQGSGQVRRVLRTRYRSLQKLVRYGNSMETAIRELINYERKAHG